MLYPDENLYRGSHIGSGGFPETVFEVRGRMMYFFELIFIVLMTVLSVFDIKMRKIPVCLIMLGMAGALLRVAAIFPWGGPSSEQQRILTVALLGALPGIAMTTLSYVSGKIGRGDGLVTVMLGMLSDCSFVTLASCVACISLALFSGVLFAFHRVGRNTRMPYIPFLTGSYTILRLLQWRAGC